MNLSLRKIICLLITAVICIFLCFGCVNNTPDVPDIPEPPDIPETPENPEVKLTSLKIGDHDISEYTIVVGSNPFRFEDEEGYDIPANEFAAEVYNRLGICLNVEEFSFESEYGPSIVFGNSYESKTVRPYYTSLKETRQMGTSSKNFDFFDDFNVFSKEDTVYFLSGSVSQTSLTVERFFNDYVMSFCSAESGDVVLASDFSYCDSFGIYNVACVGDSITFGAGASSTSATYPVVLQNILGSEYNVANFGCCAKTMCTNHEDAYTECMQYRILINRAPKIDMAVIWLGTNDADRFKDNWSEAVDDDYLASYRSMLLLLKTANPDMKIIILNPCYCFVDYWEQSIETHVLSLVDRIVEETGYPMFDMHSYTQENLTEADFADRLHPSDSGNMTVAEKVAELVLQYK